jgi:AFG3 family protein
MSQQPTLEVEPQVQPTPQPTPPPIPSKPPVNKNKEDKPSYVWIYLVMFSLVGLLVFNQSDAQTVDKEIFRTEFDNMYLRGDVTHVETMNNVRAIVFLNKDSLGKAVYKALKIPTTTIGKKDYELYVKIASHDFFEKHVDEFRKANNLKEINVVPNSDANSLTMTLIGYLPILLLIAFSIYTMRKMGGGGGFSGGGIFSIGKSKATMIDKDAESETNFASVAGLDEEKQEVMEIVDFLKTPEKYTALGGKIPKGALLIGPPGTGKTLLAKAMAGEAKVPFFSISGSDFVEMFVGVGASRVRDLFKQAREKAPCIIFIDEIDAIGRARGKGMMGGNDERENTLNQLLVEMDGFGGDTGIIMVAATNRPDVLDDALLRPGRFDRQIHINRPDLNGREQIFNVHLKKIKTGADVSASDLSKLTPGFVGADIANVCNEAALVAARNNKTEVNMSDINEAIDRVTTGLEKKNMIITPEEKKAIAYHEAGHTLTSWYLEYAHPFVRVTIIPRSESLGHALYLPKEKYLTVKEELLDDICVAMGGRAAETIVFNQISTGALGDLDSVTRKAYAMVVYYGMSPKVGNLSFYRMSQNTYDKPYSDVTAKLIDDEVRAISDEQFKRAVDLLTDKREQLDQLAALLLEKEVLLKKDLVELLGKRPWDKEEEVDEAPIQITEAEVIDSQLNDMKNEQATTELV